jgi:hypothetical protein
MPRAWHVVVDSHEEELMCVRLTLGKGGYINGSSGRSGGAGAERSSSSCLSSTRGLVRDAEGRDP